MNMLTTAPRAVDLAGVAHDCGGHFELVSENRDVIIGQTRTAVAQEFYQCDVCGEERQTLAQLGTARRAAASHFRAEEQLLSGAEIRRIREDRLQLTQDLLERALGLGEKTVVRWETERVLQPKATDNLLRLLDRDPSALQFLADLHGVEVPGIAECAVAAQSTTEEPAGEFSVHIPRAFLPDIEQAAANQGVDARSFVIWLMAERLTSLRSETRLESRMTEMHRDLAGRLDAWRRTTNTGPVSPDSPWLMRSPAEPALRLTPLDRVPYANTA